jgi:PAS domain S-box-containing protein
MRDQPVVDGQEPTTAPTDVLDADPDGRRDPALLPLDVLIEHQLDFIVALDSRACLSYVSASVERAFGYRWEELAGRSVLDFVHPDDVDEVKSFVGRSLTRPGRLPALEIRIVAKNGTSRTLEAIANNLLDDPAVRSVIVNARDVSDRAATERELRASEGRYRSLVERTPAVTYVWEVGARGAGTSHYTSPQIQELLGYTAEEWDSDPDRWEGSLHPLDREWVLTATQRCVTEGAPFVGDYRYIAKDGRTIWVHDEARLHERDAEGRPWLFHGVMIDISERKHVEEALRAASQRLAATVAASPLAVITMDVEGIIESWNPAAERIFGWTAEEAIGRFIPYVPPDRVPEFHRLMRELIELGGMDQIELVRRRKDGSDVTINLSTAPLRDADEHLTGVLAIIADITDRNHSDAALRQAEERYRTLVEQIPAAMYLDRIDADGGGYTPLYVSPQIETMLGYARAEWLESTPGWDSRWVHEEDRAALIRATESAVTRREPLSVEYRMTTANGHEMWIHEDSQPVGVDESGAVLRQGLMYDITERKRAEQMLRHSEAELQRGLEVLQRTDAERRQLLAHLLQAENVERERIAEGIEDHSLQHVAALGMRLETLRRNVEDPEQLGALDEMGETVQNAVRRLRHLLVELHPRALEQDGLGAGLRQYLDGVKTDTGTAFTFIDGSKRELELGTRVVAYRIAQEAVGNAVRHAEASTLHVTLEDTPGGVVVRIVDDGRGFDAGGSGSPEHVVVASMRERATLAGGRLDIRSGPADGTTVEFWLPAQSPQAAP